MSVYLVEWRIDIEAETPERAAEIAQRIQRDPGSHATVFEVTDQDTEDLFLVDLLEGGINQ